MNLATVVVILTLAAICTMSGWALMLYWYGWQLFICIFLVLLGLMLKQMGSKALAPYWKEHQRRVRDE